MTLSAYVSAALWGAAAFACLFVPARHAPAHVKPPKAGVTFTQDVAPILFQNCVSCHRPGHVGPFSLLTGGDARRRAQLIAQVTESRYMPPWLPEPGHGDFLAVRRLSDAQILTLQRWAGGGAEEGDPRELPPPPPHLAAGWRLGPPDLVLTLPRPLHLASETNALCPSVVIPLPRMGDRRVRAVDFRPSNPHIVRYASLFLDTTGKARRLQSQSGADSYFAFEAGLDPAKDRLTDWAPGAAPTVFPPEVAAACPPGADLVVMLRLQPDGQTETEQSQVGLYFVKAPKVPPVIVPMGAGAVFLRGGETETVTDEFTLPVAARALGITPHAGAVCRTIKADATLPDGTTRSLLWIRNWNADWAEPYRYAAPVSLPAGTRLSVVTFYDNSASNPLNPVGTIMPAQPDTKFMDALAGTQIEVAPQQAGDLPRLLRALRGRATPPKVETTGGTGHG